MICSVECFMKLRANYKYMDTRMLIGLAMFQIEDQPVVSCFLLEVVLLVGVIKNNQQLHHHAQRQNIKNTRTIACEVVWLQKLL